MPLRLPVALIGFGGHVDGDLQRVGKALEAAVVAPALGDLVEAALGLLDLLARARIDRRVIGDVDRVLADLDQFAPDRQIIDGAAVIIGVDDRRRLGGEARQILRHGDAADIVIAEKSLEGDRRGELAGPDQRAGDLENAAMDFLDEMFAAQEIGNAVEGVIVDQDRAEQRLLGLDIVRRRAIGRLRDYWKRRSAAPRIVRRSPWFGLALMRKCATPDATQNAGAMLRRPPAGDHLCHDRASHASAECARRARRASCPHYPMAEIFLMDARFNFGADKKGGPKAASSAANNRSISRNNTCRIRPDAASFRSASRRPSSVRYSCR